MPGRLQVLLNNNSERAQVKYVMFGGNMYLDAEMKWFEFSKRQQNYSRLTFWFPFIILNCVCLVPGIDYSFFENQKL